MGTNACVVVKCSFDCNLDSLVGRPVEKLYMHIALCNKPKEPGKSAPPPPSKKITINKRDHRRVWLDQNQVEIQHQNESIATEENFGEPVRQESLLRYNHSSVVTYCCIVSIWNPFVQI